jgi:uncharacterized protein (DUF2147 family)
MKNIATLIALFFVFCAFTLQAQVTPVGLWKTIDDETGEAKSYVSIYEKNGKLYGKVERLLLKPQDTRCTACEGDKKDQLVVGMEILTDLEDQGDYYGDGAILDPNNGSVYKCYIELEEDDKLKVRGYIGISIVGRTQYWYRIRG